MQSTAPKILYVTNYMPCPPFTGAKLRATHIGRQLKKCGHLTYVYIGPTPSQAEIDKCRDEFENLICFSSLPYKGPAMWQAFRRWFDYHWPWAFSRPICKKDKQEFNALQQQHDIVWFHTFRPADAISGGCFTNSIIDIDDFNQVKHSIRPETSLKRKIALKILAWKWKRHENFALQRFTLAAVCSQADKQYLEGAERVHVIPNGFTPPESKPVFESKESKRIGFIGKLEYGPNFQGMQWFAEKIWPIIHKKRPDVKLRIIGEVPAQQNFADYANFECLGFMDHPAEEMATWSGMIVPIQFGGGTRIKIIEAFSRMCPVVSTHIGAYGNKAQNHKEILLADEPGEFAQRCIELIDSETLQKNLAEAAWELFEKHYTWDIIGQEIEKTVQHCLAGNNNIDG